MPTAEPDRLEHDRALARERARRWRERHGAQVAGHHRDRDLGPALDPGDPFTDDLDRCEARWALRLRGQRFVDIRCAPMVLARYEAPSEAGCEIARA